MNNPNLEALVVGNITFPDTITSEKLVELECDCTEDGIRSLTGRIPNLKSFNADVMFKSPTVAYSLDRFLGTVPNLETLTLRLYEYGLDLEEEEEVAMDSFWRLKRLLSLEIDDEQLYDENSREPSNIGDNTLIKMAESFPGLRTLTLPSDAITSRGFTALSALQDLRDLTLRDYYPRDDNETTDDDWSAAEVRELSKCRSLRSINLCGRDALPLPAIGRLCHSCPQLSYVCCWDLKRFDDHESEEQATATVVHQSFTGLGAKRRIRFTFNSEEANRKLVDCMND